MLLGRWSSVVSIKAILAVDIPQGSSSFHYLRMFVLVERGKPEDPEKNSRSNDKNQRQTQPTCLISLYHYFSGSQHETNDLLKNATHF